MAAKRITMDRYMTPQALANACCRRVFDVAALQQGTSKFGTLVEPQAGTGSFIRAMQTIPAWKRWHLCAIEINAKYRKRLQDAGAGAVVIADFLHATLPLRDKAGRIIMIGNPPYSTGEEHVQAAMLRLRENDILAYLMRLSFLTTQKRAQGLWRIYPLHSLHPIAERPSFRADGQGDNSEYALYVWIKGHTGTGTLWPHIWWRQ